MKLFLRFIRIVICAAFLLSLASCGERERTACREVVSSLAAQETGLPSGRIYSSAESEGEAGYVSEELLCALYGDGKLPSQKEGWIEFSFFLSDARHPCEFAVFLCSSPDDAKDTARLLCARLDTVGKVWSKDGEYSAYIEGASVTVTRNYAVMCISSDPESAQKLAKELIR